MCICYTIVVITECCIASCVSNCIDFLDTVGIQCIFVINDRMETDDIAFFEGGCVTFFDKDQVSCTECRCHGI